MKKGHNYDPEEGDILMFWSNEAQKDKFAVNLEPKSINKNKITFNGVITTTQNIDNIYPYDHRLKDGTMKKPTKVICDQPTAIPKAIVYRKVSQVSQDDLDEIRKKTAQSLGIVYQDTTS